MMAALPIEALQQPLSFGEDLSSELDYQPEATTVLVYYVFLLCVINYNRLLTYLYRISGVDFTQIDGLGVLTVQTILSEVGLDPSRFPTVKHFTSWLGLCPGSRIRGGKVKSARTLCVINRAANAFRMAAQTAGRSHSALGAFYRRLRAPKRRTESHYCHGS